MKQHLGMQARSSSPSMDHHFHVVHAAGRTISGVLGCNHGPTHRASEERGNDEFRSEFAERPIGQFNGKIFGSLPSDKLASKGGLEHPCG